VQMRTCQSPFDSLRSLPSGLSLRVEDRAFHSLLVLRLNPYAQDAIPDRVRWPAMSDVRTRAESNGASGTSIELFVRFALKLKFARLAQP
jgi:hypothetical protein